MPLCINFDLKKLRQTSALCSSQQKPFELSGTFAHVKIKDNIIYYSIIFII